MLENNGLLLGNNFFTVSNYNMNDEILLIQELIMIAKMSGHSVVFTSTRNKKSDFVDKQHYYHHVPKKVHDMININTLNNQSILYLTLTYSRSDFSFVEFCLNPMTNDAKKIINDDATYHTVMKSDYFYATNHIEEIELVLKGAYEILKKC